MVVIHKVLVGRTGAGGLPVVENPHNGTDTGKVHGLTEAEMLEGLDTNLGGIVIEVKTRKKGGNVGRLHASIYESVLDTGNGDVIEKRLTEGLEKLTLIADSKGKPVTIVLEERKKGIAATDNSRGREVNVRCPSRITLGILAPLLVDVNAVPVRGDEQESTETPETAAGDDPQRHSPTFLRT